jgi:ABC-type antimicrobial peptide transport system permease subunit
MMRRGPFAEAPAALAGTLDLPDTRGSIVLSKEVLRRITRGQPTPESFIGKTVECALLAPRGERQSYQLKVVGISSDGSRSIDVSTPTKLEMKSWWLNDSSILKAPGYDSATLRAADVNGATELVRRLRKEKLQVQSIDAILNAANRIFTVVTAMLAMVSSVALFVASIGIVNTMIMSIYERTREIGTLKAMGASAGDIRAMFMIEAGLIGFLGGVTGLVLSWLLGRGLNHVALWYAKRQSLPLPENLFIITGPLALEAVFFAILVGVVAGLYPANRAARLDPLKALRHE